jgi:hypothetical protein
VLPFGPLLLINHLVEHLPEAMSRCHARGKLDAGAAGRGNDIDAIWVDPARIPLPLWRPSHSLIVDRRRDFGVSHYNLLLQAMMLIVELRQEYRFFFNQSIGARSHR